VVNKLAEDFAIRAIEAQPLDYARAVFDDTWRVFAWPRHVFPNAQTYDEYEFLATAPPIPTWDDARLGQYDSYAAAYVQGNPETQLVNPFAMIIRVYQEYVWLPGTAYGLILLIGLGGIAAAWRRLGGEALLPWAVSLALIVIPAATCEFDYRYVLPAVPFACLAAVIAFSPGTAGGAWARRLADAVRRTVGGGAGSSRSGSNGSGAAGSNGSGSNGSGAAGSNGSGAAGSNGSAALAGTGRVSGVAAATAATAVTEVTPAEAGDDERDLATDGA
jgi:hypothetical protein